MLMVSFFVLTHRQLRLIAWAGFCAIGSFTAGSSAIGQDMAWNRFRGPNGSGISSDASPTPSRWAPDQNLRWKTQLPGPGSSSPIVIGSKVLVTCWSGYGTPEAETAEPSSLRRHLVCVDRESGQILWDRSIEAVLPEDIYQGMFAEHGYASHTPTSDGHQVYAFFGKSGVVAFDMDGNERWRCDVGDGLDSRRWGSSSSPILYKDMVIITAAAEKRALIALDKESGKIRWQQKADGLESTWGTPILVPVDQERTDLVIGVPFELWGFNPDNGEFRWYCSGLDTDSFCSSVVADGSVIYAIEGRGGGSLALRAGGQDDVSKSHVLWSGRDRNRISTPVVYKDRLYFFSGGIAHCLDAKTGKELFQGRLRREVEDELSSGKASAEGAGRSGYDNRRRGGGGGFGGQDYASPIIAGGLLYFQGRSGEMYVLEPSDSFQQVAVNRVSDDPDEDFSATPAADHGQIFIRSSRYLYCIAP
jgi:outer membrane protein assembly factor BamB